MTPPRLPLRDPRTVAREIPGLLEGLFPQLAPGVVMHLNAGARSIDGCSAIDEEKVDGSTLQHAMLFELAFAAGEQLIAGRSNVDWKRAVAVAVDRQRRHFDARVPERVEARDLEIAHEVGSNLAHMLSHVAEGRPLERAPKVLGFQWIAAGVGDFSFDRSLVEVKCAKKRFGASDYRQVLMYWLLSYAAAVEGRGEEWKEVVLMNPRTNIVVDVAIEDLLQLVAAGISKIDLLQLFTWVVGDYSARAVDHL